MHTYRLLLSLLLGITLHCAAQVTNVDVEANIDFRLEGDRYDLYFSAYNKTQTDKSLSYLLRVIKNVPGDTTTIDRTIEYEDFFVLSPGEKQNIKQLVIVPERNQRIIAFVLVYEDQKVIGKDRIVIYGIEEEDGRLSASEDRLEERSTSTDLARSEVNLLRGMVVEDTKTKPGRDFYGYFFLEYNNKNINGDKLVRVSEELAIGGNTMIKVFAGDDLVVQFFVNPRATYLKTMAIQTVSRLDYYFRENRAINRDLIKY